MTLSILVECLLAYRKQLIGQRNKIVDRPFFLWRKSLHAKLAPIDAEIDKLDHEIHVARKIILDESSPTL